MNTRQRHRDDPARTMGEPTTSAGSGERLRAVRTSADQLLDTADAIIDDVLSGNSQAFLRSTRQMGGQ